MEAEHALTDRRSSCFSSFSEDRAVHSLSSSSAASAIPQNAAPRESTGFSFCSGGLTRNSSAEAGTGTISFTAERTSMVTPQQGDLIVGSKNQIDSSKKDEPKVLGSFRGSRFKSTKLLLGHPRRVLRSDDSTGSNESVEVGEIQHVENKEKPLVPASKLLNGLVNLKEELENLRKQDDNKSSSSDKNVGNGEHEEQDDKKLFEREDSPEVCSQQRQEILSAEEPKREEVRSERPDSGGQQVPMENNGHNQENIRGSNDGDCQERPQLKDEVKEVPKQENIERNLPGELKDVDSYRGRENERQKENERFVWVNNKRYQKLGKIGSGGSSHVFKVIAQDCTIYALKRIILKGRDHQTACGFHQEIEYLERLRGKRHIIQLVDYEVTDKNIFRTDYAAHGEIQNDVRIYMVLEYGEIDLARMLERKKNEEGEIDENWLRLYWEHILRAVNTIHEERIVHADLKPANFLLVQGRLKLIDFGIAKAIQNDTTNIVRESQVGTLNYMSPEAFMMNPRDENGTVKCGRASDIWSLGCILYQMVYGRTPFSHLNFYQKITEITNPKHVIEFPPISNPLILEVMKSCLVWDKSKRPRIPELLEHPFIRPRPPEHQQLRDALVQSFNRYITFKGNLALTEMVRKAAKGKHNSDEEQLDEVLIPFVRLYMHKAGKPALHELLTSLL